MPGPISPSDQWPDLAGRIVGDHHILPIRVYYEDTDFSGLVYHTSYLRWCERGRSDFVRLIGLNQKDLFENSSSIEPAAFVVRKMTIDFLKPAMMDDVLQVITRTTEIGAATIDLVQEVMRDDMLLFRAEVKIVLVSKSGRPQRISLAVRRAFGQDN